MNIFGLCHPHTWGNGQKKIKKQSYVTVNDKIYSCMYILFKCIEVLGLPNIEKWKIKWNKCKPISQLQCDSMRILLSGKMHRLSSLFKLCHTCMYPSQRIFRDGLKRKSFFFGRCWNTSSWLYTAIISFTSWEIVTVNSLDIYVYYQRKTTTDIWDTLNRSHSWACWR